MGGSTDAGISEYEQKFDGVRYLGSVGITTSLLPYPPEHRESIVSAAIHKLFNETDLDIPPTPIMAEVDMLPHSQLNEILGKTRIARNPRARATTKVTTKNIQISMLETQQNAGYFQDRSFALAHHQMDVISFASLDMSVYVSYVAKDTDKDGIVLDDSRACHVIECEDSRQANEMYTAMYNAFNQRARIPVKPFFIPDPGTLSRNAWDDTLPQGMDPPYYNTDPSKQPPLGGVERLPMPKRSLGSSSNAEKPVYANQDTIDEIVEKERNKSRPIRNEYVNQDAIDEHHKMRNSSTESMSPSPNSMLTHSMSSVFTSSSQIPSTSSANSIDYEEPKPASPSTARLQQIVQEARALEYFHAFSSNPRKSAEEKLKCDGDFLLREASVFLVPNQIRNITLSVLNRVKGKGTVKHVLLIMSPNEDADDPIHTLDKSFSSIQELVDFYIQDERILQMPRGHSEADEGSIKISNPIKRNIFISKPQRKVFNEYV